LLGTVIEKLVCIGNRFFLFHCTSGCCRVSRETCRQ